MVELIALFTGIITTSFIALVVFTKNSKSITNKFFIGLAIGLVGWSITTYFSLHTHSDRQTLLWIRWVMFFVVIQITCFMFLVRVFPSYQYNIFKKKKYVLALIYAILTAATAVSPYLFVDFKKGAPIPGPGMALFLPLVVVFMVGGLIGLFIRTRRAVGQQKNQLKFFLAGTLLMFTLVPLGNFVIPVVFKLNEFVIFSPLYSIIFAGFIAYSIIAHKLFDIKAAATRSVAYLLSLASVSFLYGGVVFALSRLISSGSFNIGFTQQIIYILLAIFITATFQPIKLFFDKLTKEVFYKDAYDPQTVLTHINTVLTTQTSLEIIMHECLKIVCDNLKISHATFIVLEGSSIYRTNDYRNSPTKNIHIDDLLSLGHSLSIADNVENKHKKYIFSHFDIGASLCLKTREGIVGYIFLGPKLSGGSYANQDARLLEIIENELAIAVKNARSFEEIQQFNKTLTGKVDNATRELRKTNDKLKALDEAKDEFISMASHQLRTPLTSVKGYVSMVLEGDAGKLGTQQRELLEQAFASSQRMVYLIADLLNVSRLKTGKFVIESAPSQLADVVEGELMQLKETAKARNLELTYKKPEHFPMLNLDETKTRQVIMNFIDNAIYYTPAGGHIRVELTANDRTAEYRVIDDGLGVPKSEQHHLFTKFFRAGNAKKARPDGTGLGLYMARKVIAAQGGSIIFESEEGKGSTFGFSFPLSALEINKS